LAGSSAYRSLATSDRSVACLRCYATADFYAVVEINMTTARGTAARVVKIQRSLGKLDRMTLGSVDRLRLLTTDHVQRLHVANGSGATRGRRTRALLRRLTDLGLVVRLPREIGGRLAGSGKAIFCLSRLGQAVLASPGRAPRRRLLWQTKPYFQDHLLAVAELYVQLAEACQRGSAELLVFHAEPGCWRRFPGGSGQAITLKPDAHARVSVGDYEVSNFVEVDLGTESLPTINRKCQVYLSYWRTGLEQQRHGVFPRVIWLVPNQRRLEGIVGVVRRLASDGHRLFTVALVSDGPGVLTTAGTGRQVDGDSA
jgi:hypothetical protein